jgi:hypothetical protein
VNLPIDTAVGDTEVRTGIGLNSVIAAAADTEGLAALMALTFTKFGFGRTAGAE